MRFGPTSLQVSSVLAKGLKRPKLRTDLRISEQTVAGETSFVVKNHETNTYNRYGSTEYELLTCCDGTRTAAEIAETMTERHPDSPLTETEVLDFLDSIEATLWARKIWRCSNVSGMRERAASTSPACCISASKPGTRTKLWRNWIVIWAGCSPKAL